MTIRSPRVFIALAILALAPAAEAQFMPGTSPMDMSVQSRALTTSVINRNALPGTGRSSADRRSRSTGRRAAGSSPETLSDARFPFQASPALRKQVISEFVDRVRSMGPQAAKAVEAELSSAAFHQSFANTMRANGLSADDAADVMTVYLIVGWEIVRGTDADPAALRAVRRQVAGQMAGNAALRNPTTRARFAEELKIIAALLGGSVENAKREGNGAQFVARVAAHYQRSMNRDFRAMRLTAQGFSDG